MNRETISEAREPAVRMELGRLQKEAIEFDEIIQNLHARLAPVLREDESKSEGVMGEEEQEFKTPLTVDVSRVRLSICRTRAVVIDMMSRLEI